MASRQAEREQRRQERIAAEQAAARAAARRRRGIIAGGVAAVVVAAIIVAIVVASGGGGGKDGSGNGGVKLGPSFDDIATLPGAQTTPPPWSANDGKSLAPRLKAIGLPQLTMEGAVVHIHQHLDLFVDGKHVTVPQGVGIAQAGGYLTILHTHDTSGIIHVESPQAATFSLGQFFAVWGLPLSANQIGGLKTGGGKVIQVWVNGKRVNADPTRIELAAHQEIVIAYGTPAQMPKDVPSDYDFPAGL